MNTNDLQKALIAAGFQIATSFGRDTGVDWYAYKRVTGAKHCSCNDKEPSLCVTPYDLQFGSIDFQSVEFSLRAETYASLWVDFKVYGVKYEEVLTKENEITDILVAAWNAAQKD